MPGFPSAASRIVRSLRHCVAPTRMEKRQLGSRGRLRDVLALRRIGAWRRAIGAWWRAIGAWRRAIGSWWGIGSLRWAIAISTLRGAIPVSAWWRAIAIGTWRGAVAITAWCAHLRVCRR